MIKVSSVSGGSDEDVSPPGDRKVHKLLPRREQRAGPDHPSFSSVRAPTVPYHPISPFVFICSKGAAQLLILKRPQKEMQKAFAAPEVKDGKCRVAGVLGSEGVRKAVRRDRGKGRSSSGSHSRCRSMSQLPAPVMSSLLGSESL